MTSVSISRRLPNQLDAWAMRCKTSGFQRIVREIFRSLLPNDKERRENKDLRNIMLVWGCDRRDILRSDAAPHPVNMGDPEVPVCVLPFVLNIRPLPAHNVPTHYLSVKAAELMRVLASILDGLHEKRLEARFSDVSEEKLQAFVGACVAFAREFVRYTHLPDVEMAKFRLNYMLPEIYLHKRFTGDEGRLLLHKAKALYYGLHGVSLTKPELIRLCWMLRQPAQGVD